VTNVRDPRELRHAIDVAREVARTAHRDAAARYPHDLHIAAAIAVGDIKTALHRVIAAAEPFAAPGHAAPPSPSITTDRTTP
jgi:hypothetical protein